MRLFWELVCTVLISLAVILAGAFLIARIEDAQISAQIPVQASVPVGSTEPTESMQRDTMEETISLQATEPEAAKYDTVPQYFQTDYPYCKYGNGTIATSGCSMTCLAMVATYLTDQEYTPDELAYHFGSFGKNNIERLEYGNEMMQLPCEKNEDWRITLQALKDGKVAIIMVNSQSLFTQAQHFIVLTGLTEDGKILVNDPYGPNYTNDVYLKNGFANGFEEYDIVRGFSNAWVYDKKAMPEEPFLFDAKKPEQPETRYAGYELPEEDIYVLACFAWAEARNAPQEVQQAVLEVVLNRLVSGDFPNTVHDVIYSSELYRAVPSMERLDEPDLQQYQAVTAAMYGPYVLPIEVLYYSAEPTIGDVWGEIGDYVFLYSR